MGKTFVELVMSFLATGLLISLVLDTKMCIPHPIIIELLMTQPL